MVPHSTLSPTKYTITLIYIKPHSLPIMKFQVDFHGLSFNCGQNNFFELLIHKTIQSSFLVTPTWTPYSTIGALCDNFLAERDIEQKIFRSYSFTPFGHSYVGSFSLTLVRVSWEENYTLFGHVLFQRWWWLRAKNKNEGGISHPTKRSFVLTYFFLLLAINKKIVSLRVLVST
jgi:hypothetical protein